MFNLHKVYTKYFNNSTNFTFREMDVLMRALYLNG